MYVYTCVDIHFYYIYTYIYKKYLSKSGILTYLSCQKKNEWDNKILTSYGGAIGKQVTGNPKDHEAVLQRKLHEGSLSV